MTMLQVIDDLPASLEWVNTDFPVSLAQSRGKVVLLLFWTWSNTHSIRLLPTLREIINDHENGVLVVGIHCPKYPHEEIADNILKAVNRHHLRFPVASDRDFEAWRQFDVQGWPSVAVIDVEGRCRETLLGDDVADQLKALVDQLLDEAAGRELRDYSRGVPVHKPESASFLKFPAKVIEARGLLYLSDTSNNRVLEVTKTGRVQRSFGSGSPGFWDGVLTNSGFSMPRGLAYADNYLYVADTGNHAIRRVNLFNGEVETLVGNGKPGTDMVSSTRRLREVGLDMPTGLAFNGPDLYICAAGMGQLWRLDLAHGAIGWFCGTGQHGVIDGDPVQASFVQPTGIAFSDPFLYVADADGNAIREVRCQTGHVQTRLGHNAFSFGREDGPLAKALLQYPGDVAIRSRGDELWIADSFNNCLRVFSLSSGQLSTPTIDYAFAEPAGLSIAGNNLWVANTNAHEIVRVDAVSRQARRLEIEP